MYMSLILRSPQLETGLQVGPSQCWAEEKDLYLLAKPLLMQPRIPLFTTLSGVERSGWCESREAAPLRVWKMWVRSRRTSHQGDSSSEREISMVAEVDGIFSHVSATSQKGTSSAVAVILCKPDHKCLEWHQLWVEQQGFQRAPCKHQPKRRSRHGIMVQRPVEGLSFIQLVPWKADKINNNKQNNSSAVWAEPISQMPREGRWKVILVKWKTNKGLNTTLQSFLTQAQVNKKQKKQGREIKQR